MKSILKRHARLARASLGFALCLLVPVLLTSQIEICDNGLDDDNDNLIDINDPDCPCDLIELVSLIPNPSFEDTNCCPGNRSQLNCAVDWIQASAPTTDFIHQCGWLGWPDIPPPQPFPDGDGIVGFRDGRTGSNNGNNGNNGNGDSNNNNNGGNADNDDPLPFWKEYAGACLRSPLEKDVSYRFQFDVGFADRNISPPIDISFFGTSDCIHLPFGASNSEFGCPTNSDDWIKLAEVRVSGGTGNTWVNTFIDITPDRNIAAMAIGPDCEPRTSAFNLYYFFDNLILADFESFELVISETIPTCGDINCEALHPCDDDFSLMVRDDPSFEYQWYLDGVALQGEIFSELTKMHGEGSYQVRIINAGSCRLTSIYDYEIPVIETPTSVTICDNQTYAYGIRELNETGFYLDTFKNINNCDSIVPLTLSVIDTKFDTADVCIIEGGIYDVANQTFEEEGEYQLRLTSSVDCDSLVLLRLSNYSIYIPDTFSPNGDNTNDVFMPYTLEGKIDSIEMQIFDRWGTLIYEGEAWDGSDLLSGIYVYNMNVDYTDGNKLNYHGTISIIN